MNILSWFVKKKRKPRTKIPEGTRYYGSEGTIHQNESLDVEVDDNGVVVAVWFRCQPLPFKPSSAGQSRVREMREMYGKGSFGSIEAVVMRDA